MYHVTTSESQNCDVKQKPLRTADMLYIKNIQFNLNVWDYTACNLRLRDLKMNIYKIPHYF